MLGAHGRAHPLGRRLHVRVLEDHHRVLPAELEHEAAMLSALSLPPPGEEAAEAEVRHAPATPAFPAVAATITAAALTANALTAAT